MEAVGRVCAVLGDPIGHSLSPVLHNAGFAELGLGWTYEAHRVPAGGLGAFLDGLSPAWRGLSLTMPLKREVVGLVDQLSERARRAGGANTLLLDDDGSRHGDNTDVPGAVAAVRQHTQHPLATGTVLGGGATAASTGLALADLGCTRIEVLARSPQRAAETVATIRAHPAAPRVDAGPLDGEAPVASDIVVSTVPVEAQDVHLVGRCDGVPVVFEVLYDPWPTPLAAAAVAGHRTLVTGLDLLVHQAAIQFELFTGTAAPLAAMRRAGEGALAKRSAG